MNTKDWFPINLLINLIYSRKAKARSFSLIFGSTFNVKLSYRLERVFLMLLSVETVNGKLLNLIDKFSSQDQLRESFKLAENSYLSNVDICEEKEEKFGRKNSTTMNKKFFEILWKFAFKMFCIKDICNW